MSGAEDQEVLKMPFRGFKNLQSGLVESVGRERREIVFKRRKKGQCVSRKNEEVTLRIDL